MIRALCAAMLLAAAVPSLGQSSVVLLSDACAGECDGFRSNQMKDKYAVGTTRLYFAGRDPAGFNYERPWVSDGTRAGTFALATIATDGYGVDIRSMVTVGDTLYFTARTAAMGDWVDSPRLWRSDGTKTGTAPVDFPIAAPKLLQPYGQIHAASRGVVYPSIGSIWWVPADGSTPRKLVDAFMIGFGIVERNADVYFLAVTCASACSPDTMATLHRMDPAGRVTAIASIAVPLSSGQPYAHLAVGTAGVFVLSANEIWFTDGAIPLSLVRRFTAPNTAAFDFIKYDAALPFVFSVFDGPSRGALWTSDGTAGGTGPITFFQAPGYGVLARVLGNARGSRIVATRSTVVRPYPDAPAYPLYSELGVLEPTTSTGVRAIRAMSPPGTLSDPVDAVPIGDRLTFWATGADGSSHIWITDGTAGGTQLLETPFPVSVLGLANGMLYLAGWEKDTGTEIYGMPLPDSVPRALATVEVTEYYHGALDHYFVTADPAEKARLDSGATVGWNRTGFGFTAYAPGSGAPRASPVCRFYGRPEAGLDSHFYSASPQECADVVARFPASWVFESANVFETELPDAAGRCGSSLAPVYRAFNERADANHRYSVHALDQKAMQGKGWQPEGATSAGITMCVLATARP